MAHYRHSGSFSPAASAAAFAAGAAGGSLLAVVYAYALVYVPVVGTFTFAIAGAFGAGAGWVTGRMLKRGATRNGTVAVVVGAAATAAAWYVCWIAWTYALLQRSDVQVEVSELLTQPSRLWQVVQVINEHGAWSLKGATPTGIVLWIFWAMEALLIVGVGALVAHTMTAPPFCETCGEWTQLHIGIAQTARGSDEEVRDMAAADQIARVAAFGRPAQGAKEWLRLDLHSCPRCDQFHVVDVQAVELRTEKNGPKEHAKELVRKLLVGPSEAQELRGLNSRLASEAARPQPAARTGT
jgi:hypothetical protein